MTKRRSDSEKHRAIVLMDKGLAVFVDTKSKKWFEYRTAGTLANLDKMLQDGAEIISMTPIGSSGSMLLIVKEGPLS